MRPKTLGKSLRPPSGKLPLPIGYNSTDGVSELPAIIGAPTARSKFQELQEKLDAYVSVYVDGSHKTDDPHELALIKHGQGLMALFKPMLLDAYQLGGDDAIFPSTLRFCPDCPNRTPLAKGKRYCPKHRAQRRRITYRLSKQTMRKKMSTVSTIDSRCRDNLMYEQEQKRTIIGLMRDRGLSLKKAAAHVGVPNRQAMRWCIFDNEFHRFVTAARLASCASLILEVDDLVRSGKELSEAQKLGVENAIWLRDFIAFTYPDEIGFISPEFAERGRQAAKDME